MDIKVQVAESILQPQRRLQRQQATVKAMLDPSLWLFCSNGFRAVALGTGCHSGSVVALSNRSGWDVTSVAETVPKTMH